ncbi:MAG: TetR/AcrR family transcriptional regulator [Spirochaetaceae bacterium]|nr:MAG: TetR/AcrR family transcriptional regulator [Spirochaetaceae bacterium]
MHTPATGGDSARARVLECAERLFMERGYQAVKLRDIADELGVRAASLYYHFPGGKLDMFLAVLDAAMDRYHTGLDAAIRGAGAGLEAELDAAARFFLSQPKIDFFRMLESDLEQIEPAQRAAVAMKMHQSLQGPVMDAFRRATPTGSERDSAPSPADAPTPELLAGSFLAIVQGIHHLRAEFDLPITKEQMAEQMSRILAAGLRAVREAPQSADRDQPNPNDASSV